MEKRTFGQIFKTNLKEKFWEYFWVGGFGIIVGIFISSAIWKYGWLS